MNRIELETYMTGVGRAARAASSVVANTSTATKNTALFALARRIREQRAVLQQANAQDVNSARAGGLAAPMVERLKLTDSVVELMAQGCEQIAALPDPVGEVTNLRYRPSGIRVGQMRVPLGVFGMVYESRPNVTIDAASLAIKSGNACVLRGGSEAMQSNLALVNLVRAALEEVHLPVDTVQMITTADREAVGRLIAMPEFVDVLIPRGGKSLIERVSRDAKVPVIKHLDGNCHIYVDISADFELAVRVIDNAKTQKFGVCNALESLLVHTAIAGDFLPRLGLVFAAKGIEMRCDLASKTALHPVTGAKLVDATEADWSEEYLAPIVSIKLVPDLDAAIAHINSYGSHHTDTILTEHHPSAMRFLRAVDSATVMINASTRFADGFEFGLGAEIGISTDKFHARGPVGLEGLTCMKWIVLGHGEVRA